MMKTKIISKGIYINSGNYKRNEQRNNTYRKKGDPDQSREKISTKISSNPRTEHPPIKKNQIFIQRNISNIIILDA